MKTLPELIASAKRELALRRNVYPGWVERGKLKPEKAEHEIDCMAGIVEVLEEVNTGGGPTQCGAILRELFDYIGALVVMERYRDSQKELDRQRVSEAVRRALEHKAKAVELGFMWPAD